MTEYIIDWDTGLVIDTFSKNNLREEIVRCRDCKYFTTNIHAHERYTHFFGCPIEEIVRCGDCVHYYEAEEYHPQGNYDRRCCKYFDTYDDEVEPDGFCAWAERRDA